jgi:hypothetical protein
MKNAIVYSIYSSQDEIELNYNFMQLRYSIDTLRKFNQDIQIYVYVAPEGILETIRGPVNMENVKYISYQCEPNPKLNNEVYATWTAHKWPNAFHALEYFELDNVLYVDADTFWQRDPQELFDKYGNSEYIYAKQDINGQEYSHLLELKAPPMNDGVNLLSKKVLKYKEDLLDARIDKVLEWQNIHQHNPDETIREDLIQWLSCQYAVSEHMYEIGNEIKFFDVSDVALEDEWEEMSPSERREVAVMHYFNYNTEEYLPQMYKILRGLVADGS